KTLVQPNGEKDWQLPAGAKTFNMQYTLPDGVSCDGDSHCVLRWHYVGWNNPDVGIDGQEQFWNCADIYVSNTCGSNTSPSASEPAMTTAPKPTAPKPNATKPTAPKPNAPKPNAPKPNAPKPNAPKPNAPKPNAPKPNAPKPNAPSSNTDTPVTTDTPPSTSGAPQPVDPKCGKCTNCYYAPSNACFLWWSKEQCDAQDVPAVDTPPVAAASSAIGSLKSELDNNGVRTLRIAFVGNVDSGKSSLIGELDDGRGLSRQAIFRHKHEVDSGRTSSIATAYMGFDAQGEQVVAKRSGKILPWSELAKHSHKKIQLIDLAGTKHEMQSIGRGEEYRWCSP
ncbi:hypothetical protein DYB38_013603, partial [Aphanomyces astaci]